MNKPIDSCVAFFQHTSTCKCIKSTILKGLNFHIQFDFLQKVSRSKYQIFNEIKSLKTVRGAVCN